MLRVVSSGAFLLGVASLCSVVSGANDGAYVGGTHGDVFADARAIFVDGATDVLMFRRPVGELLATRLSPIAADDVPTLQEDYNIQPALPTR